VVMRAVRVGCASGKDESPNRRAGILHEISVLSICAR
jgi:hypothetical protein